MTRILRGRCILAKALEVGPCPDTLKTEFSQKTRIFTKIQKYCVMDLKKMDKW
jgi:hypothetical protein